MRDRRNVRDEEDGNKEEKERERGDEWWNERKRKV